MLLNLCFRLEKKLTLKLICQVRTVTPMWLSSQERKLMLNRLKQRLRLSKKNWYKQFTSEKFAMQFCWWINISTVFIFIHYFKANIKEITVDIPHKFHNSIIGSKGKLIRSIMEENGGVIIRFPQEGSTQDKVTIRGPISDVENAKAQLLEIANEKVCLLIHWIIQWLTWT